MNSESTDALFSDQIAINLNDFIPYHEMPISQSYFNYVKFIFRSSAQIVYAAHGGSCVIQSLSLFVFLLS